MYFRWKAFGKGAIQTCMFEALPMVRMHHSWFAHWLTCGSRVVVVETVATVVVVRKTVEKKKAG